MKPSTNPAPAVVAHLLSASGKVLSVHTTLESAQLVADRFNADPWMDCETPDPDAPYTVSTWAVQG